MWECQSKHCAELLDVLFLNGTRKLMLPGLNDAVNAKKKKKNGWQNCHKAFLSVSHLSHRQKSWAAAIYTLKPLWCHNQLISFTASHSTQTQQTSTATILLMRFCRYVYLDAGTVTAVRHTSTPWTSNIWVLTMKDSWCVAQENLNWLQLQS